MNQAQGAIDAARAAGAERYAAAELTAATDALTRSRQAVRDRDYRQALADALESREHAQAAASEAADTRARLRGEAERLLTEVGALLAQVDRTMAAAVRAPRRVLRDQQQTVTHAREDLQKASAAVEAGDYGAATATLTGTKERIATVISALEEPRPSQSPRRRP